MNIGEQINNLRKQHGLSQDDFANLFNVSRQTISNWENGKSYPDLEMIIKVSDYFKISIDELLKNDVQTVKKIDNEKKAKKKYLILLLVLCFLGTVIIWGLYSKYQDSIEGTVDNGKLHITIADKDNKIYYQLDGQELNDLQTLYFEKGSYIIQIVADDYTEDIISLNYNVKIEN